MSYKELTTRQQKRAVQTLILAILSAIRESGEQGIPSGHLYAAVMGTIRLDQYETIIDGLKQAHVVRESGHVLYAVRNPLPGVEVTA